MNQKDTRFSNDDLFKSKESRRRELAALPIEEKIQILIKLQHIASNIGREAGREYKKPWGKKQQDT